jgi:peptidoglycan/xylan/chitin deacetylase (PgdA/CDA1 family)
MFYFVKTPWLLKKMYPECVWNIDDAEKVLYLTFDDGPHPQVTPFVLQALAEYDAKATFFCVGENVQKYPEVYKQIMLHGHSTGNHTFDHVNGWHVSDEKYLENIRQAAGFIDSKLFRPPYGKITKFQIKTLTESYNGKKPLYKIIMWDIVSGDFDHKIDAKKCASNVVKNLRDGSIIVFHDSEKAYPRMKEALMRTLEEGKKRGYRFEKLTA